MGRVLGAYRLRMEDVGLGDSLREVSFQGPGFLDAYYHPWQTRDQIMPDGWFRTRDIGEISRTLNAELLISIRLQPLPRDSALLIIQAYDNAAVNAFRTRSVGGRPVPKNEVLTNLDQSLLSTLTSLDEMSRAPRRPPPTPPTPTP